MKRILIILCILAGTLFLPKTTLASHCAGADIQVIQIGHLQYRVLVRFYRDCQGIPAPTSFNINYTSTSCGLAGSATATLIGTLPNGLPNGSQVPPSSCIQPGIQTTCQGGIAFGVQEWHYEAIITLPQACSDWTFSINHCCRSASIDNLSNGGGQTIFVFTTIDNLNSPVNSSPAFNTIPINQFCVSNPFFYNQGAVDPDGDSLVYTLVPCLDSYFNTQVTYATGYSPTQPISALTPPGVQINPQTGLITAIPTLQMEAVVCVRVEEYRNGFMIGVAQRDIQFSISGNCRPVYSNFSRDSLPEISSFGIRANCGDSSLVVKLDHPCRIESIATDGSDFRAFDTNGQPIAILNAKGKDCFLGLCDSIIIDLYASYFSGIHYLYTKVGSDGNTILSECGDAISEFDTLVVYVPDSIIGVFDARSLLIPCDANSFEFSINQKIACNSLSADASEFKLYNNSGNEIKLDSISGINCTLSDPFASKVKVWFNDTIPPFAFPLHLILTTGTDSNTVQNTCGVFFPAGDTLALIYAKNLPEVFFGNDTSLCVGDSLLLLADIGMYESGVWTSSGSSFVSYSDSIYVKNNASIILTITDSSGCKSSDTISVSFKEYVGAPQALFCIFGPNGESYYDWNSVFGASSYEVSIDSGLTWQAANNLYGTNTHYLNFIPQYFNVRSISNILCSPGTMSATSVHCNLVFPNCITPNGDGYNDVFQILNVREDTKISLRVFNIWGKMIFESDDYQNNWDAEGFPDATYLIVLRLGDEEPQRGILRVLR